MKTNKTEIVQRLLDSKLITAEEAVVLLEKEYYPYLVGNYNYDPTPLLPVTRTSLSAIAITDNGGIITYKTIENNNQLNIFTDDN